MNYYPSNAGWTEMWTDWDLARIENDFATIAKLHANAVRIIVSPDAFGFPVADPAQLAHLDSVIGAARDNGLRVQLTLFDLWSDYGDLSDSDTWAAQVLEPLRDDPSIAFVELRNEVNPSDPAAIAWVRHELPVVQSLAGSIPVTVSASGEVAGFQQLQSELKSTPPAFWDVHYYGSPGAAYAELKLAQQAVAPAPLFVGEGGYATNEATSSVAAVSEGVQAEFFQSVDWATSHLGLPDAAPWIFQDFSPGAEPPSAGSEPVNNDYGLLRVDGSPKPAAAVTLAFFGSGQLSSDIDGQFLDGTAHSPAGWDVAPGSSGSFTWAAPANGVDGSVRISRSGTQGGLEGGLPSWVAEPLVVPTGPDQTFTLRATATGDRATGITLIGFAWYDRRDHLVGSSRSAPMPNGSITTLLQVSAVPPPDAAYEQILLASWGNQGSVEFRNVALTVSGS
jgi:hypothetical protein